MGYKTITEEELERFDKKEQAIILKREKHFKEIEEEVKAGLQRQL